VVFKSWRGLVLGCDRDEYQVPYIDHLSRKQNKNKERNAKKVGNLLNRRQRPPKKAMN
jgi:hypothetical protein